MVQAYCYSKYIGHLELAFDDSGELTLPVSSARVVLMDNSVPEDEEVKERMVKYQRILAPYKQEVGRSQVRLTRSDNQESNLGNLVADSMLEVWAQARPHMAFINDGGLRSDLEAGSITGEDVLSVLPFNNTVDLITVTGHQVLSTLEWNVGGLCPDQSCDTPEFYQVAGLNMVIDVLEDNQGSRVSSLHVQTEDGFYEPLDPDAQYRVVITSFLLQPGKSPLADMVKQTDIKRGVSDYQALLQYLDRHNPVKTKLENRIVVDYLP